MKTWAVILAFSLIGNCDAKFFSSYRRAACGELVASDEGFLLPLNSECDIHVLNAPGRASSMDFFWSNTLDCKTSSIKVIEDGTNEAVEICSKNREDSYFLTGEALSYRIRVSNLHKDVFVHATFVQNRYGCNDKLKTHTWGIPVDFTNGFEKGGCALAVPSGSLVQVERTEVVNPENGKCDVFIEVAQGPAFAEATVSTGVQCLESQTTTSVFCETGTLHLIAPPATTVRVTILKPKQTDLLQRYSESCLHKSEKEKTF